MSTTTFTPDSPQAVAECLAEQNVKKEPLALTQREVGDLDKPVVLEASKLTSRGDYDVADLVIGVQSGMTALELEQLLTVQHQTLGLTVPDNWRLLDWLAENPPLLEQGLRRSLKERVLGLQVAHANGTLSQCGGKVVKNVTGYDLQTFYVGAHHSLCVITDVTLRLDAMPEHEVGWWVSTSSFDDSLKLCREFLSNNSPLVSACEIIKSAPTQWAVYIRADGPKGLMPHLKIQLQQVMKIVGNCAFQEMEQSTQQGVAKGLVDWSEVELHLRGWLPVGESMETFWSEPPTFDVEPSRVQVRPACGLIQWGWTQDDLAKVEEGKGNWTVGLTAVHQGLWNLEGFLQMAWAPLSLRRLAACYNLAPDGHLRSILQQLKGRFDPNNILYNRMLPIEPMAAKATA